MTLPRPLSEAAARRRGLQPLSPDDRREVISLAHGEVWQWDGARWIISGEAEAVARWVAAYLAS